MRIPCRGTLQGPHVLHIVTGLQFQVDNIGDKSELGVLHCPSHDLDNIHYQYGDPHSHKGYYAAVV